MVVAETGHQLVRRSFLLSIKRKVHCVANAYAVTAVSAGNIFSGPIQDFRRQALCVTPFTVIIRQHSFKRIPIGGKFEGITHLKGELSTADDLIHRFTGSHIVGYARFVNQMPGHKTGGGGYHFDLRIGVKRTQINQVPFPAQDAPTFQ
jgi:hypothetical protein